MVANTIEKELNKKKLIFLFLIFIAILPTISAEILSETSERECSNGRCLYSTYQGKVFHYENNRWYYFRDYTSLSVQNRMLIYRTPRTNVNISMYVTYNGQDRALSSLSSSVIQAVDLQYTITSLRDENKFNLSFNKPALLTRIGFRVDSNRTLTFNQIDRAVSDYLEFSIDDIRENRNVSLDRNTNIYWVDISDLSGRVRLDPLSSFYSLSNDGYLSYAETDLTTCMASVSTGTTIDLGHPAISPLNRNYGMLEFNTSTIASNQTLNQSTVEVYVGTYSSSGCNVNTEEMRYYVKGGNFGTLDCSDVLHSGGGVNLGTVNYNQATGWKVKTVPVIYVNRTFSTLFEIEPDWLRLSCSDGTNHYYKTRMSEFTGTTSDPIMKVWTTDYLLNLESPTNNSEITIGTPTDFKFNLTSVFTINNCSLIIDDNINKTINSGINKTILNPKNKIEYQINETGDYSWLVNCSYNSTYKAKSLQTFNLTQTSGMSSEDRNIKILVYPILILVAFMVVAITSKRGRLKSMD